MQRGSKITPSPTSVLRALAGCICIYGIHSFSPTWSGRAAPNAASSLSIAINGAATSSSRGPRRGMTTRIPPLSVPFLRMTSTASSSSGESSPSPAATASADGGSGYPPASDGEALQSLFAEHCDEGLMTEGDLRNVPAIKDMLEQGDLLSSELSEIWKAAPKFPQVEETSVDKIDVDSFIQVYRDIDDLFEEDDDKEDVDGGDIVVDEPPVAVEAASISEEEVDEELKKAFATVGNDDGPISFSQLRTWEEITIMIEEEGTLGEDELVTLWESSLNVNGKDGDMDLQGFVKFNDALDDLFELEEEEEVLEAMEENIVATDEAEDETPAPPPAPRPIITEEDLPPGVLFSQLADENYLVSREDLPRWGELAEWLKEGELTKDELDTLFGNASKAPGTKDMLDEEGFCGLYDAIDSLFEDVDDDDEPAPSQASQRELKEELLEFIEDIVKLSSEEGLQLCGLDCSEMERERVLEVASELEREPYNQVVAVSAATGDGAVKKEELVGMWELAYSSSSTMKYNEGLSGLAGGLTTFGGLRQKLTATKYLSDVEYTETMVGKFGGQEAEVRITGDWDLRTEVSLFTGKPSNVLSVVPDKVFYATRSDKADHWKSLGPMNLLVLSYLDEDLRIMRGNTSTDTLFIWRRIE